MAQTMTRIFDLINTNFKTLKDDKHDKSSIYKTSLSFEGTNETSQSYDDDSFMNNNRQIRQNKHYIKHPKLNRNDDHITSLKRRVRKQKLNHGQNQITTFQATTFQLSSSMDLFLISYPQQSVSLSFYRAKKSSCVVPLSLLMNNWSTWH